MDPIADIGGMCPSGTATCPYRTRRNSFISINFLGPMPQCRVTNEFVVSLFLITVFNPARMTRAMAMLPMVKS